MSVCHRVVARRFSGSTRLCTLDTSAQYLVWFDNFVAVPPNLRAGVQRTILDAFRDVRNLVFDFDRELRPQDLCVYYSPEISNWPAWGDSTRAEVYGVNGSDLGPGDSYIYLAAMQALKIQTAGDGCEPAFENTDASLGRMIARTTVEEIAHMLGLDTGGWDGMAHEEDQSNYLWLYRAPSGQSAPTMRVNEGFFEYTVRSGDTLSSLLSSFKQGTLHPCIRGATELTVEVIWNDRKNQEHGHIAHPTKSGIPGRRCNDPDWIYPGEKVAFPQSTFCTSAYRDKLTVWLGPKQFTADQIKRMNDFVSARIETLRHRVRSPGS